METIYCNPTPEILLIGEKVFGYKGRKYKVQLVESTTIHSYWDGGVLYADKELYRLSLSDYWDKNTWDKANPDLRFLKILTRDDLNRIINEPKDVPD
jgi:hypothetical protein